MQLLFVHQGFPGQFRHMARALAADPANRVVALAIDSTGPLHRIEVRTYAPQRSSAINLYELTGEIEAKLIRGEAAARAAQKLSQEGFRPDLIVGHPGWGEMLFLADVWPDVPQLHFIEFFYRSQGADFGFDPEFSDLSLEARIRLRTKNAHLLASLDLMTEGLSPTHWQKSLVPEAYQPKVNVTFDGIDTELMSPDGQAGLVLPDGRTVTAEDEVITFVNRNLEPYRGFHVFMRALPAVQRARPAAITLIVGGDEVSYGRRPQSGGSWRQAMLEEVGDQLDQQRIIFLGRLPYAHYRQVLRLSRVHAYLTYPFVLSWSLVEAMSVGCLVLGSATPPVQEVIRHEDNGLLVPFFNIEAWEQALIDGLSRPASYEPLRRQARLDVLNRYDLKTICLPRQLAQIRRLAAGAR